MKNLFRTAVVGVCAAAGVPVGACPPVEVGVFGDEDVLGTGQYANDPLAGATLAGLTAGEVTFGSFRQLHGFPFSPSQDDYAGTDQIYVGSVQQAQHDGYAGFAGRLNGPQVIKLDYSSLVPEGQDITTLTLGIAADDFQFPVWGQPYAARVNGVQDSVLTNTLNGLNQTGPLVQFFTIGIDPGVLKKSHILTLSIDQGGDGGDGWAIDFLTIGVTPSCDADFDGGGTLDLFDFLAFVNEFNAGTDRSDCDCNGVHDLFDFLCFVNAFNAGCK